MIHVPRRQHIGIIGGGNMGEALVRGLVKAGVPPSCVRVVESDASKAQRLARAYGIRRGLLAEAARRDDIIVLAVKPQDLAPVLSALRESLRAGERRPLLMSIAAGVPVRALEHALPMCPIVRVMPNLPAKVGAGISVLTLGRRATATHRRLASAILACVGDVMELPERHFDAVTAISGSGPAYFFTIFHALREAGVRAGLPKDIAQRLAVQTALGSVQVVREVDDDLERLIAQVASKKGTTEAALNVFERMGLTRVIQAGVDAARKRSRELSSHHLSPAAKGSLSSHLSGEDEPRGGKIGPSGQR